MPALALPTVSLPSRRTAMLTGSPRIPSTASATLRRSLAVMEGLLGVSALFDFFVGLIVAPEVVGQIRGRVSGIRGSNLAREINVGSQFVSTCRTAAPSTH